MQEKPKAERRLPRTRLAHEKAKLALWKATSEDVIEPRNARGGAVVYVLLYCLHESDVVFLIPAKIHDFAA